MTAREVLDGIKARLSAATPGPWTATEYDHNPGDQGVPIIGGGEVGSMEGHLTAYTMTLSDEAQSVADAVFIAAAPTDVARLTGALEAVLGLHAFAHVDVEPWALGYRYTGDHCKFDGAHWPCPTVAAIENALEPK